MKREIEINIARLATIIVTGAIITAFVLATAMIVNAMVVGLGLIPTAFGLVLLFSAIGNRVVDK